jgi:thymidylate synthase
MLTVYENASDAFEMMYVEALLNGEKRQNTLALFNVGFLLLRPEQNDKFPEWRKFKLEYAKDEWQWYLSQSRSIEAIKDKASIWKLIADENGEVNSNYGWQWNRNHQLDRVVNQLKENPSTRQAVISIYDGKEAETFKKDTPCTLAITFNIRADGKLHMSVMMRSMDIVFGFCNDQYCFSRLQIMIAEKLNVKVGTYYHFACDAHVYERHFSLRDKYLTPFDLHMQKRIISSKFKNDAK